MQAQENESVETGQRRDANGGVDETDARIHHESSSPAGPSARMPVARNAKNYNMEHKYRGMAIIFNHEIFDVHNLQPRTGTNVDRDNLFNVLGCLGFQVTVQNNKTYEEIDRLVQKIAKLDHTDCDCLLIAVLTHGSLGNLYSRDTYYKPNNLWNYFTGDNCTTLAGKPKLFFIQACQGNKLDGGVNLVSNTESDGSPSASYKIPVHADFLIVFSTVPGYYSWRNTARGSWFMQALCEELRRAVGTERDILTLLTFVCQRVALDFESNTPDRLSIDQQKQVPCITSMLTRLLVFSKK